MRKKEYAPMERSSLLYKGECITLRRKAFCLPNRHIARMEFVEHPGAALIIPFVSLSTIILLRQFRPVAGEYLYELPAGTINEKEAPLACARREIREETGYSAGKFTLRAVVYPVPGYSTEKIYIYKAEGLKKDNKAKAEKEEVIECMRVGKKQIQQLFKDGKLNDAKTICALALCGWL